jgi:hypothetical protein
MQSLIFTAYIIIYKPLEDKRQMSMEIFNESMLLMSSYIMFAFTDFVDDAKMRSNLGWV